MPPPPSPSRSLLDFSVVRDPLVSADLSAFSPSRHQPQRPQLQHRATTTSSLATPLMESEAAIDGVLNENAPLLMGAADSPPALRKKPFYRARPLWLVPFAVTASIARGMTLASRVEVFTQLSCARIHGHHNYNHTQQAFTSSLTTPFINLPHTPHAIYSSIDPLGPTLFPSSSNFAPISIADDEPSQPNDDPDDDPVNEEDPRNIPSSRCLSDPNVQAGAARLQTMMTTTMGLLSALTTGWWGHFGERHGRTRVLAIATLGLFLTDLTFILVSTPSSPLSQHGHILLLLAPIIEGLLGGWSTLHFATSAYVSDCTSSGSRAHIFSRFTGIMYLGFSVGPGLGGWLIKNPLPFLAMHPAKGGMQTKVVTSVFWVAIFLSFVNLMLVLFVFPESLDQDQRQRAMEAYLATGKQPLPKMVVGDANNSTTLVVVDNATVKRPGIVRRFLSPLAIFLPVVVSDPSGFRRKRRDWSLTLLAATLFGYMLSTGVYQLKYLYAEHVFGWGAEQLSYYISFMGGARATFLLFLLPSLIAAFKPKPAPAKKGKAKAQNVNDSSAEEVVAAASAPTANGKKPKPTRAQLGNEIAFDLILTRFSLVIDIISNILVTISPAPEFKAHSALKPTSLTSPASSEVLFVLASSLTSMGSGAVPAVQSLALCMMQVRALDSGASSTSSDEHEKTGTGALFGALAVLQAVGQMILGPMLFGLVYSGTVAQFPKAIFATAIGILVCALVLVMLVRNPVRPDERHAYHPVAVVPSAGKKGKKKLRSESDEERGRSRISKDLRGGAAGYGAISSLEAGSSSS